MGINVINKWAGLQWGKQNDMIITWDFQVIYNVEDTWKISNVYSKYILCNMAV